MYMLVVTLKLKGLLPKGDSSILGRINNYYILNILYYYNKNNLENIILNKKSNIMWKNNVKN